MGDYFFEGTELDFLKESRRICRSGYRATLFSTAFNAGAFAIHAAVLLVPTPWSYFAAAFHGVAFAWATNKIPYWQRQLREIGREIEGATFREIMEENGL